MAASLLLLRPLPIYVYRRAWVLIRNTQKEWSGSQKQTHPLMKRQQNCGRGNLVLTFFSPGNLVHGFANPGNLTHKFEVPGNLALCILNGPGKLVHNFANPGNLAQLCAKPGNLAHFEEFDQVSWTKP